MTNPDRAFTPPADEVGLFAMALDRLDEALEVFSLDPGNSVVRDGLIKRFEFSYEMAVGSLRVRLRRGAQPNAGQFGYRTTISFSADVGLIDDPEAWIRFTNSRQSTSHDYNEPVAAGVAASIPDFSRHARALLIRLQGQTAIDL